MDASGREAIKGKLLDRWIEDLRREQAPTVSPEMELLSPAECAEVLELARWYKSSLYRGGSPPQTDVEALARRMRDTVLHERAEEAHHAEQFIDTAPSFGALIREARTWRDIDPRALEQVLKLPVGTLNRLEVGDLPPHRLPVESMLPLLRGLRLESGQVVHLLRQTSASWASAAYSRPPTQLGRTDATVAGEERRQLLSNDSNDADRHAQELTEIERYCRELARRLV